MFSAHHRLVALLGASVACFLALAPAPPPTTPPTTPPITRPTTRPAPPATQPDLHAPAPASEFVRKVEWAHGAAVWRAKPAVEATLVIEFGGNEMLRGTMLYDHHRGLCRMELASGPVLVFDGEKAWVSPSDQPVPMARFHLLTWPYFLAAPFKLNDPGTNLRQRKLRPMHGRMLDSAKLTFDAGIGDAPDDWYIVYLEGGSQRLHAMAYIVTYGRAVEEASKEPHAIVYGGWTEVEGVTLSTEWSMHDWNETDGVVGEPLGRAILSNVRFVTPAPDAFVKPDDAAEDALPTG